MPGSWRRQPLPPGWETDIRPQILTRDNWVCQWPVRGRICGALANQVDHINPDGSQTDPANLRALCQPHHNRKSAGEAGRAAGAARRKIAAARFRPPEQHPGLLDRSGG